MGVSALEVGFALAGALGEADLVELGELAISVDVTATSGMRDGATKPVAAVAQRPSSAQSPADPRIFIVSDKTELHQVY